MSLKFIRITSWVLIPLGIAAFVFGSIIAAKVSRGEVEIQKAERTVQVIRQVGKINPYTKQAAKVATDPMKNKIQDGKAKAAKYQILSVWLRIAGIVAFAVGVILLFFFRRKSKKK